MQLTVRLQSQPDDPPPVEDPDPQQIANAIEQLEEGDFASLARDPHKYIQASVEEDGLLLEYQDGSLENHYGVVGDSPTRQQVADAFVAFAAGSDQYRRQFDWEPLEMDEMDFTLIAAGSRSVEDGGHIDWEQAVELPGFGLPALVDLYRLLCGGKSNQLAKEFVVVAETSTDEIEEVLLIPLPEPLTAALREPRVRSAELAAQWRASDAFPVESWDDEDTRLVLEELIELARVAARDAKILLACDVH